MEAKIMHLKRALASKKFRSVCYSLSVILGSLEVAPLTPNWFFTGSAALAQSLNNFPHAQQSQPREVQQVSQTTDFFNQPLGQPLALPQQNNLPINLPNGQPLSLPNRQPNNPLDGQLLQQWNNPPINRHNGQPLLLPNSQPTNLFDRQLLQQWNNPSIERPRRQQNQQQRRRRRNQAPNRPNEQPLLLPNHQPTNPFDGLLLQQWNTPSIEHPNRQQNQQRRRRRNRANDRPRRQRNQQRQQQQRNNQTTSHPYGQQFQLRLFPQPDNPSQQQVLQEGDMQDLFERHRENRENQEEMRQRLEEAREEYEEYRQEQLQCVMRQRLQMYLLQEAERRMESGRQLFHDGQISASLESWQTGCVSPSW